MSNEGNKENVIDRLEKLPENQGWNEYDYLRNEAIALARQGRKDLWRYENAFHEAISRIRWETMQTIRPERIDELLNALISYPTALRAVMDNDAAANENLRRAESIKRVELMEKRMKV